MMMHLSPSGTLLCIFFCYTLPSGLLSAHPDIRRMLTRAPLTATEFYYTTVRFDQTVDEDIEA